MAFVVVHRGARDAYQVALALQESGTLQSLVTDLYWPSQEAWAGRLESLLPPRVRRLLHQRQDPGLEWRNVELCLTSGLLSWMLGKAKLAPFSWQRRSTRWADATLGRRAGRIANRNSCDLLSYSYYGRDAFAAAGDTVRKILFQLHPHPASVRRILRGEMEAHPECAASLNKEWEMSLPEWDFRRLEQETRMADQWIVASSYTRETLVENGIPRERVEVIPYGTDLREFTPPTMPKSDRESPLRLLFVGTMTQRKGIRYLVDALTQLRDAPVHLTVCGRVVDDLQIFKPLGSRVTIRPNVSRTELIEEYRSADLFVFPSLAEGFGHVLLESLACGTPILTTSRTAGPDLIRDGREGYLVPCGDAGAIAERIEFSLDRRQDLREMRSLARRTAERWTWRRFREQLRAAISAPEALTTSTPR